MQLKERFFIFVVVTIVLIQSSLFLAAHVSAQPCPIPNVDETKIELCQEGQTEILRGNCLEICIRGKMEKDSLSLSIDQTNGSGFHFDMDNGPTSVETAENRIFICSDSTSCGSASIILTRGGQSTEIGSVRSNVGTWVLVSENECVINEDPNEMVSSYRYDGNQYRIHVEKIQGKGRQREVISKYYRAPYVDCGSDEVGLCDDFSGSILGGYCDMSLDLNVKRKRCLGLTVMPYGGGYPCAEGYSEPSPHWSWCGCILYMSYHEWRCSQ